MIFYHFTSRYHLPFIFENGFSRGDVPLSKNTSTQAVNLTTDGRAHRQKYNRESSFVYKGKKHKLDKSEIRITVNIPITDELLIHWPVFTQKMKMQESWLNHLYSKSDDNGISWYLYFNKILPSEFEIIEINSNNNGKWLKVDSMPELITNELKFVSGAELQGTIIDRIPQDVFISEYLR